MAKCACGCGEEVSPGKRYVARHYFRALNKTKEHSQKVSKHNSMRILSDRTKVKISNSLIGRKLPPEVCAKISLGHMGSCIPNHIKEYTTEWLDKEYKEDIKSRDSHKCQSPKCDHYSHRLVVHHIDYEKKNSHPLNLVTLCISCHMIVHKGSEEDKLIWAEILSAVASENEARLKLVEA